MPLEDILAGLAEIGGSRGSWRSRRAILDLVRGASAGGSLGYAGYGGPGILTGGALGGALGWFLFLVLSGVLLVAVLTLALLAVYGGWLWLAGGL